MSELPKSRIAHLRPFSGFALVYEADGEVYLLKHGDGGAPVKATKTDEQRLITPWPDQLDIVDFGPYPYHDLFARLSKLHQEKWAHALFAHLVDSDNSDQIRIGAASRLENMLSDAQLRDHMVLWVRSHAATNRLRNQQIDWDGCPALPQLSVLYQNAQRRRTH